MYGPTFGASRGGWRISPPLRTLAIAFFWKHHFCSLCNKYVYESTPPFFAFLFPLPLTCTHSQTCAYTAGQFNGILYEQLAGGQVGRYGSFMVTDWECPPLPHFLLNWPAEGKQWSDPAVPSPQGEREREAEREGESTEPTLYWQREEDGKLSRRGIKREKQWREPKKETEGL